MKRTKEILFIAICIFLIWFITCDRKENTISTNPIREEINRKKMDSDSIKFRVDTIYKERVKVVTRWKTIRHDSLIPCEEKLLVCDTIIKVDSTLISELRQVIKADSVVISKQDTLIHAQDMTIIDLTKSVKKEKRQKRLIAGLAVLIGIVGLTK